MCKNLTCHDVKELRSCVTATRMPKRTVQHGSLLLTRHHAAPPRSNNVAAALQGGCLRWAAILCRMRQHVLLVKRPILQVQIAAVQLLRAVATLLCESPSLQHTRDNL